MIDAFVSEEGSAISEVALRHLFRVHPNLLAATQKCASGHPNEVPESSRRILKRYGVLTTSDILSGAMLTRGFESLSADSSVSEDRRGKGLEKRVADSDGFSEWAEELAALGMRRNILERRLRELTLNFLRFNAITTGKPTDVKDRALAVIQENQRESLRHLSAEEAMNRFLWTDIVKLVVKEWSLFQKLLGDKEQFLRNCELINDRFDAHAKPADHADFALYRRALSHLEDRLARFQ